VSHRLWQDTTYHASRPWQSDSDTYGVQNGEPSDLVGIGVGQGASRSRSRAWRFLVDRGVDPDTDARETGAELHGGNISSRSEALTMRLQRNVKNVWRD
jgi:hypothetical protein